MRFFVPLSLSVALLIPTLFLPHINLAAVPTIALEVAPSTVQLGSDEATQVQVVVRNPTAGHVQDLSLSMLPNSGIRADIRPLGLNSLQPNASVSWPVTLKRIEGNPKGAAHFQLKYNWKNDKTSELIPGVAFGTLQLQEVAAEALDKIAEVKIEGTIDVLEETRPGVLFVVVRNVANFPITISSITPGTVPKFISIKTPNIGKGSTLAPQNSQVFPIDIAVGQEVRSGEYVVLLEVGITHQKWGRPVSGNLVVRQSLKVGVLGESDILKLVGVPSFLLLPGFLMVASFLMLWARVRPRKPIQLELKSTEFWVIAITLSLVTAPLYPKITGLFTRSRDYLIAYGLRDVFYVWMGSIISAFLAWVLVTEGIELRAWIRRVQQRRRVPLKTDEPIDILRKLAYHKMGFVLRQVDVQTGTESKRYFLIAPETEGQTELWIAPAIIIKWTDQANPTYRQRLMDALNQVENAEALVRCIEEGQQKNRKMIVLEWESREHPDKVEASKVKIRDGPGLRIIREED